MRYKLPAPDPLASARCLRSLDDGRTSFRPGRAAPREWDGATWTYKTVDDSSAASIVRAQLTSQALPVHWRNRDRATQAIWPPESDIVTWAGIGAMHALAPLYPRPTFPIFTTDDQRPHALAYLTAYAAVFGAYMDQQQTRELTNNERREIAVGQLQSDLGGRLKIYQSLLEATESEIVRFLTEAEHVVTTSKDDKLLWADRPSLLAALGEAAASRLSINPTMGEAYLIPRKNKVDFQPGYKGLIRLAYRSGEIDAMGAEVVYEGEHYKRTGGTSPGIEHTKDDQYRTGKFEDIIGAYAVVWLKGSSRPVFRDVTKATLLLAAEASGHPGNKKHSDVWRSHPEAMCFKTALIRVANLLPRSDKFRDFHMVSQHETLREVNVEPPPIAGLDALDERPVLAAAPDPETPAIERVPLCTGKAAGIAKAIRERRAAYAKLIGKPFLVVYKRALARCSVPPTDAGGMPEPEQLTVEHGKAVSAILKAAIEKLEAEQVVEPEILDRQPGEDDPADVEPPTDHDHTAAGAP